MSRSPFNPLAFDDEKSFGSYPTHKEKQFMNGPSATTSPFQNGKQFTENLRHFDIKETEFPREGLIAIHLLMKGKFIVQLTELLKEEIVPQKVKLLICQFFIEERHFETNEIVAKVLKENVDFNLKEKESTIL